MHKRSSAHSFTLSVIAPLAALSAWAAPAWAQTAPRDTTVDAQLFQPAIGANNFLTVESAEVPEHKQLSFGLTYNYQRRPYVVFSQGTMPSSSNVIDSQLTGELDIALGLFDRFQVGLGIPFTNYLVGDLTDLMGASTGGRMTE